VIEISELFLAPQGEGRYMGRQALFVRVNRCNLSCDWCDSHFTWDRNHPDYGKGVKSYTPSELAGEMVREAFGLVAWSPMAVVFTGGEPMIYQQELPEVIDWFRKDFKVPIEVETAGTIVPSSAMLRRCHFNVSPKLASAGNERVPRPMLWNSEATKAYALVHTNIFKLVVGVDDERSLKQYLEWLHHVTLGFVPWHRMRERIYLMPEGVTAERIAERQGPIIKLAQKYGVCATTRMHITAWNDKRGM